MPLQSRLFKHNERLQRCLVSDPHHVERGEHVALFKIIQRALMLLGSSIIV
jgi:hypothetical protein